MRGVIFILAMIPVVLFAQTTAGYYDGVYNKWGDELYQALYDLIKNHDQQGYDDAWNHFKTTDVATSGKVWDIYSDNPGGTPSYTYTFTSDKCGNYDSEGDCYNREHSFPKSWFNDNYPMYSDLFALYPTDGYVNNKRGNYPFGEVSSSDWTSSNGSKVGNCSYPGYSDKVFEPIDEYKGD
ncbi:MAG: endonuclease, partial [Bacteroidia bacterium]|nr:endonuclease [Bacteroidia bacterium]